MTEPLSPLGQEAVRLVSFEYTRLKKEGIGIDFPGLITYVLRSMRVEDPTECSSLRREVGKVFRGGKKKNSSTKMLF